LVVLAGVDGELVEEFAGERRHRRRRGNIHELLSHPDIAAGVGEVETDAREMDRLYSENLTQIRKAGRLPGPMSPRSSGSGRRLSPD
jgi:hypothetical protein